MARHAKSIAAKRVVVVRDDAALYKQAVELYKAELIMPSGRRRLGLRSVCKVVETLHFENTGKTVVLNHSVLNSYVDGGQTKTEANEARAWLTSDEVEIVILFALEMGKRGFPLSHRRLKEHVDLIARARWGDKFPKGGVGRNWTTRFVTKHDDHLKMMNSRPLEDKRGKAGNPTANTEYFRILKETLTTHKVSPRQIFGCDEVGIQNRSQGKEKVIAGCSVKVQHQQTGGTRTNTTVIATICADGSAIPPTVIFKGKKFQTSWMENNPLKASVAVQEKGWTDGEIGKSWLEVFDKSTQHKIKPGEHRLLLVDGHSSHFTLDFLLYARDHKILIICYPAHATHIYQGLDVVVFGVLKEILEQLRIERYSKSLSPMTSDNFLEIYAIAHTRALTETLVKSAFKQTGVWPFNDTIIPPSALAPSKETSSKAHLPVPTADPASDALSSMMTELALINQEADHPPEQTDDPEVDQITQDTDKYEQDQRRHDVIARAVDTLGKTDLSHLLNNHVDHLSPLPTTSSEPMDPTANHQPPILPGTTIEEREAILLATVQELREANAALAKRNITLQAGNILNEAYCGRVKAKLAAQDDKKKKKKTNTILNLGGMPRVITDDDFIQAKQNEAQAKQTQADEKVRKAAAMVDYRAAKDKWEKEDEKQKEIQARESKTYKAAILAWEKAKEKRSKTSGRADPRPKMGFVPKKQPVPKVKDFTDPKPSDSEEESDAEDEDDDEDDD